MGPVLSVASSQFFLARSFGNTGGLCENGGPAHGSVTHETAAPLPGLHETMRAKGKDVRYYGSLERVGMALATNVILALATSLLQLTQPVLEAWLIM